MDVHRIARRYQQQQAALARRIAASAVTAWGKVDPSAIDRTWAKALPRVVASVTGAQALAAAAAEPYVASVLGETGPAPDAIPDAPAFAGVASDGRPLPSLLDEPRITALQLIQAGAQVEQAMAAAAAQLEMIVRTQVADAGRTAVGTAIAARPDVGYIRLVSEGACSRCIVLAGKFYKWNAGFLRHPNCHCTHVPARRGARPLQTPKAHFDKLSAAVQDKAFGRAGAQAIRDGADISQVVNARRGIYTASVGGRDVKATTSGAGGRRAVRAGRVRLMPEQIYDIAGEDRDEAIRLLRQHGYLRGEPTAVVEPAVPRSKAAPKPRAVKPEPVIEPVAPPSVRIAAEPPPVLIREPVSKAGKATRAIWEDNARVGLEYLAGYPVTAERVAEIKDLLAAQLREEFAATAIETRVTPDGLKGLLADGRFRTQFEHKNAMGLYNPKLRADVEDAMFGIAPNSDPKLRPIYGYLDVPGAAEAGSDVAAYGEVRVVFKDDVRARTTVCIGDSLQAGLLPSPIDAPTWESANVTMRSTLGNPLGRIDYRTKRTDLYVEAQIHNGVTLADIERIILGSPPTPALRMALERSGIPWEVVEPET